MKFSPILFTFHLTFVWSFTPIILPSSRLVSSPLYSTVSSTEEKIPLPFMNVESLGLKGRWDEKEGNFILRPKNNQRPFGVIHFLGYFIHCQYIHEI